MIYRHPYLFNALPSLEAWDDILHALSAKVGFSSAKNLPCHLAAIAGRRLGLRHDLAHDHVEGVVLQRAFLLGRDLGLNQREASTIAHMLVEGLRALRYCDRRSSQPYWPSGQQWIEIDQAFAAYLFNVHAMTVSTYLAWTVQDSFAGNMSAAKRHVHRVIAAHARKLANEVGMSWLDGVLIQWRLGAWLNSFDA